MTPRSPILLALASAILSCAAAADQPAHNLPREKKITELKESAAKIEDHEFEALDCAPDAPFLVCMETSRTYKAGFKLDAYCDCVTHMYKLFKERFADLYDAKAFEKDQICLVYIFEDRPHYAEFTKAPAWSEGGFDASSGTLFIYRDMPQIYETLFHEGARQLLAAISRTKDPKAGDGGDSTMFWLSRGIGTWLESFKHDATGGFVLGEKSAVYAPFVRKLGTDGKGLKLDELLKMTSEDFEKAATDMRQRQSLTAQAWAFWYFMQTAKEGAHRKSLDGYVKLELEHKGGYEAAKECFGDLEALNTEYQEYLKDLK